MQFERRQACRRGMRCYTWKHCFIVTSPGALLSVCCYIARLGVLLALVLNVAPALASNLVFKVTDTQGRALENAVVMAPEAIRQPLENIAVMDQVNKSFAPHVLVIQQGQKVLFPNSDHIRHHVYSFSAAKPFEIRLYAGVPEAPIEFDQHGVVVLGCNIHDSMVGYILVADTPMFAKTGADGIAMLRPSASVTQIQVWHPLMNRATQALMTIPLPEQNTDGEYPIQLDVAVAKPVRSGSTFGERFK